MRVYRSGFRNRLYRTTSAVAVVAAVLLSASCTTSVVDTTEPAPPTSAATTAPAPTEPPLLLGPGIDEGLIRLGVILPLTGTRAALGNDVLAGHEAYWLYVNEELGGIGGFDIDVITADNAYQLDRTGEALNELKDQVVAISSTLGSPITSAMLPVARSEDLVVMAGSQVSAWGAEPNLLLDLALASYRDQVAIGLAWAAEDEAIAAGAVVGIIHQEGFYGDDCVGGLEESIGSSPFEAGPQIIHSGAQTEFLTEVTQARDQGVELLILCTLPEPTLAVAATAALLEYQPLMLATAQSYSQVLPAALGGDEGTEVGLERLQRLYVLGALSERENPEPGLLLYQDNLARAGLDALAAGWYTFFGYTQAATMHAVLGEALSGRDLTRGGLLAAIERLEPIDFGTGAGSFAYGFDGVPTPVDAVGRPVAATEALFGVERISGFIRLGES